MSERLGPQAADAVKLANDVADYAHEVAPYARGIQQATEAGLPLHQTDENISGSIHRINTGQEMLSRDDRGGGSMDIAATARVGNAVYSTSDMHIDGRNNSVYAINTRRGIKAGSVAITRPTPSGENYTAQLKGEAGEKATEIIMRRTARNIGVAAVGHAETKAAAIKAKIAA